MADGVQVSKRLQRFLHRYKLDGALPDTDRPILDALRYREQNLAMKAGSTLAFCGLMIASILVQLAAPSESLIFVARGSPWALYAKFGLILMLLSSFMSLVAITWGRSRYSSGVGGALGDLAATVSHKRLMRLVSAVFCLAGSMCAAVCLLGPLLQ